MSKSGIFPVQIGNGWNVVIKILDRPARLLTEGSPYTMAQASIAASNARRDFARHGDIFDPIAYVERTTKRNPRRPAMTGAAMLAAHARAVRPAKKKTLHKGKTAAVARARVKAARIQTRDYIVLTGAKSGRIYARYDCEYTPMKTVKIAALALFKAKGEAITATQEKF